MRRVASRATAPTIVIAYSLSLPFCRDFIKKFIRKQFSATNSYTYFKLGSLLEKMSLSLKQSTYISISYNIFTIVNRRLYNVFSKVFVGALCRFLSSSFYFFFSLSRRSFLSISRVRSSSFQFSPRKYKIEFCSIDTIGQHVQY